MRASDASSRFQSSPPSGTADSQGQAASSEAAAPVYDTPSASARPPVSDTLQSFLAQVQSLFPTTRKTPCEDPSWQHASTALRLERYQLIRLLGGGGNGLVYLGRHPQLPRLVAVKLPRPDRLLKREAIQDFLHEARAASQLDHPHIVPLHEVGIIEGVPYITYQYIPGPTLRQWIQDQQTSSPRLAAECVVQLAEAMQHAHERGVFHCDLKPANVLLNPLASYDSSLDLSLAEAEATLDTDLPLDGYTPKIADFGAARIANHQSPFSQSELIIGTPAYMSPEQAEGKRRSVGARSDVYGLGTILYELLTGQAPFDGQTQAEVLRKVCQEPPTPPRASQPTLPRDLEAVCLKCLAKRPEDRYFAPQELLEDLERFLAGKAVKARPIRRRVRLWRWIQQRPRTALAGVAGLVVLAGLLAAVGWFWAKARYQEQESYERFQSLQAAKEQTQLQKRLAEEQRQKRQLAELQERLNRVEAKTARPAPNWVAENLTDLREAARFAVDLTDRARLRSLAVETLGGIDLRQVAVLQPGFEVGPIAFDPHRQLLALGEGRDADGGLNLFFHIRLIDPTNDRLVRELKYPRNFAWELQQRLALGKTRQDGCHHLGFSPDGRWLVASTRGGFLYRWDLNLPQNQPVPLEADGKPHTREPRFIFAPDGHCLYSLGRAKVLRRWVIHPEGPWESQQTADADPSARVLAYRAADQSVLVRDLRARLVALDAETLKLRQVLTPGLMSGPVALCPNQNLLVHPAPAGLAALALPKGIAVPGFDSFLGFQGKPVHFDSLAFAPQGDLVLTSDRQTCQIQLWEMASGRLLLQPRVGSDGGYLHTVFLRPAPGTSSGPVRFAVSDDHRTLLFEVVGGDIQDYLAPCSSAIRVTAASRNGQRFACLTDALRGAVRTIEVWEATAEGTWQRINTQSVQAKSNRDLLAMRHDGKAIAYVRGDQLCWLDLAEDREITLGQVRNQKDLHFDAQGKLWLAVGQSVRCFEPPKSGRVFTYQNAPWEPDKGLVYYSLRQTPHGTLMGRRDGRIRLISPEGEVLNEVQPFQTPVWSMTISPDGQLAVVGDELGQLQFLQLPSLKSFTGLIKAHRDTIPRMVFLHKNLLLSVSWDGTLACWDRQGQLVLRVGLPGPIEDMEYLAARQEVTVLVRGERAVRVWRLDRIRAGLNRLGIGPGLELPAAP